jgi:deoxyribose-phosphate aldolase
VDSFPDDDPTRLLAALIDATLLKPDATARQVTELCEHAVAHGTYAVCVSPNRVRLAVTTLQRLGADLVVAAVAGFPSGAHHPAVTAEEARRAVDEGATEIDMVIDIGAAADGDWASVAAGISDIRAVVPGVLKVILETALLETDGIIEGCRAAEAAGADLVKTSTGFHPAGGASVEAVRTMRRTVGDRLGVKASGGIRSRADALTFADAGASRLGLSALAAVLGG